MTVPEALQIAIQHHQAGQLPQAEALYCQILSQEPSHAEALHLLGLIAHQVGQHDVAADLIRRSIAIDPNCAEAHSNLGDVLGVSGQLDLAIAAYQHAIALRPDYPEAYCNLGVTLKDNGQLDAAIAAYRHAIALRPSYPVAESNLGNALREKGQLDEAVAACRYAIALKPDFAEAHNNLGLALTEQGKHDEAIAAYRAAIAIQPRYPAFHNNLGVALRDMGQLDEAIAPFRQAIALNPGFGEAHNNLGNAFKDTGLLDEAIACYRQAMAVKSDCSDAHSNLIYALHFHPGYDARSIAEEHRLWNLRHAEPARKLIQPHANDRSPERRLRIGYVSPDLRRHPVGRFLLPLLSQHDKSQVEVFAYAQVLAPDALTEQLRSHTDAWRDIVGLSDAAAAELVRNDRIDILIDLAGHTSNNRLLVFAQKPAPVQVTYLGYPDRTGLSAIDYRLSDQYLDPPETDESCYSEKIVRLPGSYWCYQMGQPSPEVGPSPIGQRGHVTFGCLNNFCKVSDPALGAWARTLHNVPNSELLLHSHEGGHRQRVYERLEQAGIERGRVRFAGMLPAKEYLDIYRQIDIALDTFPCAGGTTTCDALWMRVPVVSLLGRTTAGRAGLSILSNVGLPDLVARSEEEYVSIATTLASDVGRLGALRSDLRQRMQKSPLMDAPGFARNIEAAYRQMWRTWCTKAV